MNRRHFLMSAAAVTAPRTPVVAASEKVNIAIIGVRGRGRNLANEFALVPEANIVSFVDVDENVLRNVANGFEKKHGKRPKLLGDMRRVFDDKSIDAVAIATPDHWHAPAAILACQSGKDVYVEKPCCHNVREGRMLVIAARKYNRVVQHGTQARSNSSTRRAIEMVHAGKIGKVLMAKAWDVQRSATTSGTNRTGRCRRASIMTVGLDQPNGCRLIRTASIITGTGTGISAPAIWATMVPTRWTRHVGPSGWITPLK